MRDISASVELKYLTTERVWVELSRSLTEKTPSEFFKVLRQVNALETIFPELNALFGVPQPMRWHPEIDTGIHSLKALEAAREKTAEVSTLFAVLCHDLGKGLTDPERWPSHRGHEGLGADLIQSISKLYKWPTKAATLAEQVARYHTLCHTIFKLKPATIITLLTNLNGFRQPDRVEQFALACESDAQGRSGLEKSHYPQGPFLIRCLETCLAITAQSFVEKGLKGKAIGEAIQHARTQAIKSLLAAEL
jgi:tRNA nucleotidyltransferase (CCA-adding enzyme)